LRWNRHIRGLRGLVCLGLLLTVASCGASTTDGTLFGSFRIMIGGLTERTLPERGDVIIRQGNRLVDKTVVSSGHSFAISVPAGSYQITSSCKQLSPPHRPPGASQPSSGITIHAGIRTRANLTCTVYTTAG
jgi:hypothetical protein